MDNTIQDFMAYKGEFAKLFNVYGPIDLRDVCFHHAKRPTLVKHAMALSRSLGLDDTNPDDRTRAIGELRTIYETARRAVGDEHNILPALIEVLIETATGGD